jgi:hypothetical protein
MASDNGYNDPFFMWNKWSVTPPMPQLPVTRVFPGYHASRRNTCGVY